MPAARALVDCVVLSLQTACVFYPCCKDCFSRIDVEQQDATRCRCFKCGYSCAREQVDYRYRLSLKVTRNSCIFGLTVFGTCLNPFFGIHAKGLQRLVENSDGASSRSTLLMKAVEDCFIGRHFVFGIKVPEKESLPWVGAPVANGSSSKETAHFIATQMILPNATGLGGCTVVSYYRMLLHKAAEYELASTDCSKTCGAPAATLLLIPHHYPTDSFNHSRLSASDLLSHSPPSSQSQDGALSPTPPWEQSLGLVTSSAEQEEGCSLLSGGGGIGRRTENQEARPCALRGCPEGHKVKEEKALSPSLSLGCSTPGCPSLSKYEKAVENPSVLTSWISPPLRGHNLSNERGFSTRRHAHTVLSSSLSWGDLPFSESLSEYLCENNHLDSVVETEPQRNDLEICSQHNTFLRKSNCVFQSNTQITDSQSQISLEITNKSKLDEGDRCDLPDKIYKTPNRCAFESQAKFVFTHESNLQEEKAPWSSENEEEQLEGDLYNCSADLFGSSLLSDRATNKLCTRAKGVGATTEVGSLLSKANEPSQRSEKDSLPTPNKQKRKSEKHINADSLLATDKQEVDFIPPTQSTPIVKVCAVRRSPAPTHRDSTWTEISSRADGHESCAFYGHLPEFVPSNSCTSPLCESNRARDESIKENPDWEKTSSRHGHRLPAERALWKAGQLRALWKAGQHKKPLLTPQHPRVQRGTQSTVSIRSINYQCYSCDWDGYEDGEGIIPPTPVPETRPSGRLRRRMQTGDGSSDFEYAKKVYCKKTLLETFTSSQGEHSNSKAVEGGIQGGPRCPLLEDNNEACDWSRDLFSDSI